jgi:hypothetical protein
MRWCFYVAWLGVKSWSCSVFIDLSRPRRRRFVYTLGLSSAYQSSAGMWLENGGKKVAGKQRVKGGGLALRISGRQKAAIKLCLKAYREGKV